MSEPADLTPHLLRQIRDEIIATRTDLGGRIDRLQEHLGDRIDTTNERIDTLGLRVEKIEETLVEMASQQRFIVRNFHTLARRDVRIESEVDELRGRLEVVEKKLASG